MLAVRRACCINFPSFIKFSQLRRQKESDFSSKLLLRLDLLRLPLIFVWKGLEWRSPRAATLAYMRQRDA